MHWWTRDPADVATSLQTDLGQGLTSAEAAARLARDGSNSLTPTRGAEWPRVLLAQFQDVMILLLIGAAIVSASIGELSDAVMIVIIVLLNAVIGLTQALRASRAISALQELAPANVTVVRSGTQQPIPARELVTGDLIRIESGARIAADVRLAVVHDLEIDESTLTGESVPSAKQSAKIDAVDAPLGDRSNMAFGGTIVTRGTALGIVVATGSRAQIGQIAGLIADIAPTVTPLQRRLARVSRILAIAASGICIVVFGVGVMRGQPPLLMLMTAISLAVAAIPEAMPAIVTVLLAVGARRMASAQALIRRLPAVETLGSVTFICTDKTGTLTQNRMTVVDAVSTDLPAMLTAIALCNDADIGAESGAQGEPTEVALAAYASDNGYLRLTLEADAPRTATFAFTSERKRMTTVHLGAHVAYMKGAPDVLLSHAPELRAAAEAMAASGLRVIAVARRDAVGGAVDDELSEKLEALGCVGLSDPPRRESAPAIAACHTAGIATVMITGDHADTAEAIAREIGIVSAGDGNPVMTGETLATLSDAELSDRVMQTRVYARVDPAQKIRIVAALQGKGQFVAMTGDGVNDAPALARADIGVAMGENGTDVARESADLVLLDDNFATIVAAIREGRRIYDNIRKFIRYVLACNLAEVLVVFVAPLLGLPLPLLPVQILWINLLTDGVPGLALAAEPAEADVMTRPPQPPAEGLFTRSMWTNIGVMGCVLAGVTIAVEYFAASTGRQNEQTMVFTVLTLLQVGQAIAVRSHTASIFSMPIFGNVPLLVALAVTVSLHLAAVYLPIGNRLLHTVPLSLADLGVCALASVTGLVVSEALKVRRRATSGRAL